MYILSHVPIGDILDSMRGQPLPVTTRRKIQTRFKAVESQFKKGALDLLL